MSKVTNNIYRRKDGRFEGRIYQKSSHKYRSVYAKTYSEVVEKLNSISEAAPFESRSSHLLFSAVLKDWLDSRVGIKPTSVENYRSKITKHILPYFRRKAFSSLKASDLEKFKIKKLSEGLSESYVAGMVVIIKSASKYASVMHNCGDPFRNVSLPKVHKSTARLLTSEEQAVFTKACMRVGLAGIGCFLALFAGLRIGEVCGLKWENIDLKAAVLSVRYNVQRVTDAKGKSRIMLLTPKTDTSVRDIPLPDFIIRILKKYRQSGEIFVVSGTDKPTEPRSLTNHFKSILKDCGLPPVKFHSLRHCFATNFLRQCGDVKSLSEILGHSNVTVTLSIYVHSSMEQKMACMEKLAALL